MFRSNLVRDEVLVAICSCDSVLDEGAKPCNLTPILGDESAK